MTEYLYQNAPLVEVICEVRWALQRISSIPGGQIDPHFDAFKEDSIKLANEAGFGIQEQVQNQNFPREFRPYAAEVRFRRRSGEWPVFQIGPGMFTVNMTPPYEGWSNFQPIVRHCVEMLLAAYPLHERYLKINRLELRYVDAFDKSLGFSSYMQFAPPHITIKTEIPADLINQHAANRDGIEVNTRVMMPIKSPKNSMAIVGLAKGLKDSMSALIADIIIREDKNEPIHSNLEEIVSWFDEAHIVVSDIFDRFATQELKNKMGPKHEVRAQ